MADALVTLTDVYDPLTFDQAVQERSSETNAFLQSGAMVRDAVLDSLISTGGTKGELPFYNDLSQQEPNYSGANTTAGESHGLTDAKMEFRTAFLNEIWGTYDLSREIALADPLAAIVNRVSHYWNTVYNRRLIASMRGILADNTTNDSSSLLTLTNAAGVDVSGTAYPITADAILEAEQNVFGDRGGAVTAIAMHSWALLTLQKADLIDYLRDSDADVMFPTYLGKRVIVDDALWTVTGTNQTIYTSILFGEGAVRLGEGMPTVPSAVERLESTGEGGGGEKLYSRKTAAIVPNGFSWTDTTLTGGAGNTQADEGDLILAANWDNVMSSVKNGSVAFIQHN